jgi:tetratricopeptide (TPR) repeat protein
MDQALANAQHALQTIDTDLTVPSGTSAERVDAYRKYLRSMALAIIGKIQYKRQLYPDAEGTLRKAIDADAANPDPVVLLSLALSLDMQKKYQEALVQANHAVDLTKEDTDVGKSARFERDRLAGQIGPNTGASIAPAAGAPNNAPQTAAPPNAAPQNGTPQNSTPASH